MDINPVLFPAVTNRESFSPIFALNDEDTGDLLDLTGCTIQIEIRRAAPAGYNTSGYGNGYNEVGAVDMPGPTLAASIGNGITILDTGTFQLFFTEQQMRSLYADTYSIACTISDSDTPPNVRQLFLGRLPVLNGMVSA